MIQGHSRQFSNRQLIRNHSPLILLWLGLSAVCFLLSSLSLNIYQNNYLKTLRNSTLFYAKSDLGSDSIASWANSNFHIRTIETSEPNAGQELFHLTSLTTITSPTLVLQEGKNTIYVSGGQAVRQWFDPVISRVTPVRRARIALLVMFCIMLVACVLKEDIGKFVAYLPALGLVAVGSLRVQCLNCNSVTSWSGTIVPVLMTAYLLCGVFLFTAPRPYPKPLYQGFALLSGLIPMIQAGLQLDDPKLCAICLIFTFIASAYFLASLQLLAKGIEYSIACPKAVCAALIVMFIASGVRSVALVTGVISSKASAEIQMPRIVGNPIAKFINSGSLPAPGTLLVVTLPGCHSCEAAKSALAKTQIVWKAVSICSMFSGQGCFDPGTLNFPAPLFIMCDPQGNIGYQREGWVETAAQEESLFKEIEEHQRTWGANPRQ